MPRPDEVGTLRGDRSVYLRCQCVTFVCTYVYTGSLTRTPATSARFRRLNSHGRNHVTPARAETCETLPPGDGIATERTLAAKSDARHGRVTGTLPAMEGPESTTEPSAVSSSTPETGAAPARPARWWLVGGVAVILILLAVQVVLLATLDQTVDELAATRLEVADLEARVAVVDASVTGLSEDIDALADSVGTAPADSTGTAGSAEGLSTGFLPRFEQGQQDRALGMRLGPLSGPDAYSGETVSVDPADGTKRIWMIWAHWCPYCQQELPSLASIYPSLTSDYPDIELLTITSSIDPSRGNPLGTYLEDGQFPFPILVDDDSELAGRLGVNAFPFWVVTDGDGTVLLRTTGLLEGARFQDLVTSLDAYGT